MGKKLETTFKEKVLAQLELLPFTWAEKIQQVTKRGTPDILACVKGRFVALELKSSEADDADPLQRIKLLKITKAGGLAYVVNPTNWPFIFETLEGIANANCKNESKAIIQRPSHSLHATVSGDITSISKRKKNKVNRSKV